MNSKAIESSQRGRAAKKRRFAKLAQRLAATQPCPEIRWADIVRVEAMGTDAFGAFEVWLIFTHCDGSKAEVSVDTRGYWGMVDSLHTRFPSVSSNWYDEMSEQPWHVEEVLFEKSAA